MDWRGNMKKHFVLLLALFFVARTGQTASVVPVKVGLKGGMSIASLGLKNTEGDFDISGSRLGLAGGAFVSVSLGTFSIQPEILYVQKGAQEDGTLFGVSYTITGAIDYIEIPVLLRVALVPGPVKPCIFVGPSMGFLMNAKIKVDVAGLSSTEEDVKEYLKSSDIGLVFGAGLDVSKFTVDVRYNLGLTNVLDVEGAGDAGLKNNTIMAMVGFSFL
jgi:hypothetical protein